MNKSLGIANQSQIGRMQLKGLVGLQLLTAAAIILAAVLAFSHYSDKVRSAVEQDLLAVAEVKNQQITDFLKERISDAEILVQRAGVWMLLDPEVRRAVQGPDMSASIPEIARHLRSAYGYGQIVMFDMNLQPVFPRHADHGYDKRVLEALKQARQTDTPQIVDVHFHDEEVVHFGVVHPIRASGALEGPVIGLVFIEMPAHPNLYRLVSSWPTAPSKTGESLLVRRDNDQVTYLSPLRHDREMRPLRMQKPLADKNLFAAKAIREEFGIVRNGIDYHGVPVMGAALAITGTPWVVLVKMDEAEAYAGITSLAQTIAALAACFIVIAGMALYLLWRNRAIEFESHRSALELALDESSQQIKVEKDQRGLIEQSFAKIFDASPLPKQIHSLRDLRITAINRAHEHLFGYPIDEIREIDAWFEKVYPQADTRDLLRKGWMVDIERIRDGKAVSESPELRMQCRDGTVRTMRASMSVAGNDIIIVWTDLTDLRNSEMALIESERRFRGMVEQTISGFYVVVDGRVAYVNPRVTEMVG